MTLYCLDTSVYVEGWNKYYSMDLCPDYWTILDKLAQQSRIFSPFEVKREINEKDDGLSKWFRDRQYFFVDVDNEVQKHLRHIMKDYGRLVDSTKQRSIADPWVIAVAKARGAIVVTKEMPVGINSKRIKIPDVCHDLGLPWMNDFQFAHEIGIRFVAQIGNGADA